MSQITAAQVAGMMDISLLQPQFTRADIDVLIDQPLPTRWHLSAPKATMWPTVPNGSRARASRWEAAPPSP